MISAIRTGLLDRGAAPPRLLPAGGLLASVLLSLVVSPVVAGALLFAIGFALALVARPWIGYALLLASVPVQQLGAHGSGPSPFTLTQVALPIALVAIVIHILAHRQPLRWHALLLPVAALLLVQLASALKAEDGGAALAELARWGVATLALLVAIQFLAGASEQRIVALIVVLGLGGVFEAGFGAVQSLLALGPFQVESGASRAFGTFGMPNSYAGYLAMTLFPPLWLGVWYLASWPAALGRYWQERRLGFAATSELRKRLAGQLLLAVALLVMAAFILFGILVSLSRGAWLGVAAGVLITALLYSWLSRLMTLMGLGVVGLVAIGGLAGWLPNSVQERLTSGAGEFQLVDASNVPVTDENFATVERIAHWQAGWGMFTDHPALGVGVGNFNARYDDYYVREGFQISQGHAHNYYIHTLAETGLAGLLAYLTIVLGALALGLLTILRQPAGFGRAVTLAAFGSLVALAVHNVVENLHVLNLGIVIGFLWALVIAGHERALREGRTTSW